MCHVVVGWSVHQKLRPQFIFGKQHAYLDKGTTVVVAVDIAACMIMA